MRLRKKDTKNIMRVGIFITFLTVVLMVMVISIGKENSAFEGKADIRARVGNVSALKTGSYVEFRGIRIGAVTRIEIISEEEVEVTMRVTERQLEWIKKDSKVSITNAGLVGDKFLEIIMGSKDSPKFNAEKDVLYSETQTDFKKIINTGESIAVVTERILLKLDHFITKLDDGDKITSTMSSLQKTSANLEKITADMKGAKFGETMGKLNRVTTQIEKGPGTLHSLIYDDAVHDDLRAVLGGASRNKVIKYFIRESIKKSEQKN